MATENDVVINPQPTPVPTPVPQPEPVPHDVKSVTPDSLRNDFTLAVKAVRGVSIFLPSGMKANVEAFLSLAETAQNQPWIFDVAVSIYNRFHAQGVDPAKATSEQLAKVAFEVFVEHGEKSAAV